MWQRPDVDFIQTQDVAWQPIPDGTFAAGGQHRVLSEDPEDGAHTAIVRFRNLVHGRLAAGADVFVLEGSGTLNGATVHPLDYLFLRPDTTVQWDPSSRTTIYFGPFGAPLLDRPERGEVPALEVVASENLPWVSAGWADTDTLEPGAAMKWLRRDGPGMVLLAAMLPGWKSRFIESHPIYEESFKLTGDILMGRRGVMHPGAYFYRGPDVAHGPLYSRTGTMSLIRWSAPATSVFVEPTADSRWEVLAQGAYRDAPPPALGPYG